MPRCQKATCICKRISAPQSSVTLPCHRNGTRERGGRYSCSATLASPSLRSLPFIHRHLHPRRRRALPVRRPTLSLAPCCSTTRKGGEGASGGAGHRGRGRHGGSGRRRRLPAEPGLSPCRPLSYPRPAGRRRRRRVGVGGQGDDPWGANLRRLA